MHKMDVITFIGFGFQLLNENSHTHTHRDKHSCTLSKLVILWKCVSIDTRNTPATFKSFRSKFNLASNNRAITKWYTLYMVCVCTQFRRSRKQTYLIQKTQLQRNLYYYRAATELIAYYTHEIDMIFAVSFTQLLTIIPVCPSVQVYCKCIYSISIVIRYETCAR